MFVIFCSVVYITFEDTTGYCSKEADEQVRVYCMFCDVGSDFWVYDMLSDFGSHVPVYCMLYVICSGGAYDMASDPGGGAGSTCCSKSNDRVDCVVPTT